MGNKYEVYALAYEEMGAYCMPCVYAGESFITAIFAAIYARYKGSKYVKIEWR